MGLDALLKNQCDTHIMQANVFEEQPVNVVLDLSKNSKTQSPRTSLEHEQ